MIRIFVGFLFHWCLVFCILISTMGSVDAQSKHYLTDDVYFETDLYKSDVVKSISKLLSIKSPHLDTLAATVQLEKKIGAVIDLKRVPKKQIILEAHELANTLRKSTITFLSAYGHYTDLHVSFASGYVLGEDGIIVVSDQIVSAFIKQKLGQNLTMAIGTEDGKVYLVTEILSSNPAIDLAIVKVDTRGDKLFPLALGNRALQGDEIFVMSHPKEMLYYFSQGIVARNFVQKQYENQSLIFPTMDITADYAAGSNGGPIVDVYGNLVATASTTESIYYYPEEEKSLQMVVKHTSPIILFDDIIKFK